MTNKEIDKIFKDKLNADSPTGPADWDVFSEILKKSEGFEYIDLDETIESKLKNHRASLNDNHWQLLRDRLVKEENIRRKLFTSKSVESLLLLLLLLFFQNYQLKEIQNSEPVVINTETKVKSGFSHLANDNNQSPAENTPVNNSIEISKTEIKNELDLLSYANSQEAYESFPIEQKTFVDIIEQEESLIEDRKNYNLTSEDKTDLRDKSTISLINTKKLVLKNEVDLNVEKISLVAAQFKGRKPKSEKYITPTINTGIGIAHSGFDPIYKIKGYSAYSTQFGAGLLYSSKNKGFEIQTGLRYTKKKYQPNELNETYGSLAKGFTEISLNEIQYDILDIPLNFKFFFKEGKKTSYFAKVGLNANFALSNNYIIEEGRPNSSYQSRKAITDGEEINQAAKLSQKDFHAGILQTLNKEDKTLGTSSFLESVGQNTFITLTGELGLERKISDNNALTMGLEYNKFYNLEGIGPNNDKLSALTLNLGIKHRIGE